MGDVYLEEFSLGNAEDVTEILSTTYSYGHEPGARRERPQGAGAALLRRKPASSPRTHSLLEPGLFARKYYARGVGTILEVENTGEVVQLVQPATSIDGAPTFPGRNRVMIAVMSDTTSNPNTKDRFTLFLGVACAALAVLTLLLAWQNRALGGSSPRCQRAAGRRTQGRRHAPPVRRGGRRGEQDPRCVRRAGADSSPGVFVHLRSVPRHASLWNRLLC